MRADGCCLSKGKKNHLLSKIQVTFYSFKYLKKCHLQTLMLFQTWVTICFAELLFWRMFKLFSSIQWKSIGSKTTLDLTDFLLLLLLLLFFSMFNRKKENHTGSFSFYPFKYIFKQLENNEHVMGFSNGKSPFFCTM